VSRELNCFRALFDSGTLTNIVNFKADISIWDLSSTISISYMFYKATVFDQDLSAWNVTSMVDMRGMLYNAKVFDHDLSAWDVASVRDMNVWLSSLI
jgi:hypothetical protein